MRYSTRMILKNCILRSTSLRIMFHLHQRMLLQHATGWNGFWNMKVFVKGRRRSVLAERRAFAPVLDKYQMEPIWIIWEVIFKECKIKDDTLTTKIVSSLLEIFGIRYTSGVQKRRRFLIYFAIAMLTEQVDMSIDMIGDRSKTDAIIKKINVVYKDVKKNEVSPETDYLYSGIGKTNLDKTIERLETMNKMIGTVPRS